MKLLLTNDDGIDAEGIKVLAEVLSADNEVFVVAPDVNNSAASNRMTIEKPMSFVEKDLGIPFVKGSYALGGTPADCVFSGLGILGDDFDLVLSGINNGPNLGTDIIYSGTCGAARTACLNGVPAVALSIDTGSRSSDDDSGNLYYENLAQFVKNNLEELKRLCGKRIGFEGHFLVENFVNVNAPAMKKIKGAEFSNPCMRRYYEKIERGENTSTLVGSGKVVSCGNGRNDAAVCGDGFISVSVVQSEPAFKDMNSIENTFTI